MKTVRRFTTIAATPLCVSAAAHAQTWRDEANTRIEQHRKADLIVKVVDAAGSAVEGAGVHVRMQRHAFEFGTAVNESLWASTSHPHSSRGRRTSRTWRRRTRGTGRRGARRTPDERHCLRDFRSRNHPYRCGGDVAHAPITSVRWHPPPPEGPRT